MKYTNRFAALTLAVTMGTGFVALPMGARASEEGRRNTALGLGVAAAALLLTQKNKAPGIIVGAGALVAATQIGSDHDRYRRDHDYGYDSRYYDQRRYNDGYGNNDNRRYHEDVRNNQDRYNHDQYAHDQYNHDRDRYNDGQSGYRVGDNSARYHEQGSGREVRKAR